MGLTRWFVNPLPMVLPAILGGLFVRALAWDDPPEKPPLPADGRFAPYDADPDHPWNRLHEALFVRKSQDGDRRVHTIDPFLYRGSRYLLEGEPHRRALAALDAFLASDVDRAAASPLERLFLQRDLWAAFDHVAWYPDDWVFDLRDEPAARALRSRLARAIGELALSDREIAALPDNYARALAAGMHPREHDPDRPEQSFLPDLFDETGPWVRFHEATAEPMTPQHFEGAGGRAAHVVFLKLPGGRAATERYVRELNPDLVAQFPPGTAVAMVRRALAVDETAKVRVTPITELVQIRVFRRIAENPSADLGRPDFGEQDVYEFVLDRTELFAGRHGLRAVHSDEPAEPFARRIGDPFDEPARAPADSDPGAAAPVSRRTRCIDCHQAAGIQSVRSTRRGLAHPNPQGFRTYALDVELNYTVGAKVERYDWGLLQGLLEAR